MADICGEAENPPSHAHAFRDLAPLHQQLHAERVAALKDFQAEVHAKTFPYPAQSISMRKGELEKLKEALERA